MHITRSTFSGIVLPTTRLYTSRIVKRAFVSRDVAIAKTLINNETLNLRQALRNAGYISGDFVSQPTWSFSFELALSTYHNTTFLANLRVRLSDPGAATKSAAPSLPDGLVVKPVGTDKST